MYAKIIEAGNGFPIDGETVYSAETESLYVVRGTGAIRTDDLRGNYVLAQVEESDEAVTDLSDAQFAELRALLVVDIEEDICFCHGCGDEVKRGANFHEGESYCDGCEAAPSEDESET